jgi:hypothetical protein
MNKIKRIILSGDLVYENVEIIYRGEKDQAQLPEYFEDAQVTFRTAVDGSIIAPSYSIMLAWFSVEDVLPDEHSREVSRITLGGNITHSPAKILDPGMSEEVGVPWIFNEVEQFVFSCQQGTFITTDFNVIQIQL